MTDYIKIISIALITLAFSAGAATKAEKAENNKHTHPKKLLIVFSECADRYMKEDPAYKKDTLSLIQKMSSYGDYSKDEAVAILLPFFIRRSLEACKARIIQSLSEEKAMGAMRFWDETN